MATETPQKFPRGHAGALVTSTNEAVQEEVFIPAGGLLVAVNTRGNDHDFGTLVADLKENGIDPDALARIQSIMRVVKYPFGEQNCSLGLQIGPSGLGDCKGFIVDSYAEGGMAVAQASKFAGGPFHCGTGKCRHKKGEDDEGNPISPLHFVTKTLFWRDDEEDGPLRFEGPYPEVGPDGPFNIPVHLSWDEDMLDWAWWTTTHIQLSPKPTDTGRPKKRDRWPYTPTVPTIRPVTPTPATTRRPVPMSAGGKRIGDLPWIPTVDQGVPVKPLEPATPTPGAAAQPHTTTPRTEANPPNPDGTTGDREQNLRDFRLRRLGGFGDAPSYNTVTMQGQTALPHLSAMVGFAAPATLSRPHSSDRRKFSYDSYPNLSPAQVQQFESSPVCGQMAAFGAQGGAVGGGAPTYSTQQVAATGDPWAYTQKPDGGSKYAEGTASGGWVLLPPEVRLTDAENGFMPEGITRSTTYFLAGPGAWFGAGQPEFSDGSIQDGYSWGWDSSTGDLLFRTHVGSAAPVNAIKFDLATQNIAWRSGTNYYGILEHVNTAERTYTFMDASGIVALASTTLTPLRVVVTDASGLLFPNAALTPTHILFANATGLPTGSANLTYDGVNIYANATAQIARLGLGVAADASAVLKLAGNTLVSGDSYRIYFGTGADAYLQYDGTDMKLVTDAVAASDFVVDCGTAKTLELAEAVYKDENMAAYFLPLPALSAPGKGYLKDGTGTDLSAETLSFATAEYISGNWEINHDYKEGTDLVFHIHWQGHSAPGGGTDNVRWELKYSISRAGSAPTAETTIYAETAITTQYVEYRSDFAAINGATAGPGGTALKVGDQFIFRIGRVTATSDEYGGDALPITIGMHYQIDTLGSRQITTK